MTTLTILPTYEQKQLKCYGTVAAGEHVAVTVTGGADLIGEGKSLRLRVLFGPNTVAMFPLADTDEWTVENVTNAACTLDLFTDKAEKCLRFGGKCLWLLEDMENHTLYAAGEHHVRPWPKEKPGDEPTALDDYPELVEDMAELRDAWTAYQATIAAELAAKQDAIADLTDIRTGAGKGATALQPNDVLSGEKIKSSLLPSFVDDVVEYGSRSAFPAAGESSKIYVALDTNKVYRWSGSGYIEIAASPVTSVNGETGVVVLDASDVGAATKADATLAERGFTEWTIAPSSITYDGQTYQSSYYKPQFGNIEGRGDEWFHQTPDYYETLNSTDPDATSFTYTFGGQSVTATRTALSGYQLGSQEGKPLASEAEAEALRQGKFDKTAVVAPSTTATTGQAADAKATGDAIAALPTKADIDAGWWSDWTVLRDGVDVTGQIPANQMPIYSPENEFWDVASTHISGDRSRDLDTAGAEDATNLSWEAEDGQENAVTYIATRHRVDLRYFMPSSATVLTPSNGEATLALADRTCNKAAISSSFTTLNLTFPTSVSGKMRDFLLRVKVAAGVTAPALAFPSNVSVETFDGNMPTIADGGTSAAVTTILTFTESDSNDTFLVESKVVKTVIEATE